MLNPIHAIKQLYHLDHTDGLEIGSSRDIVESHEKQLGIELPPLLYHYLLELGNGKFNTNYHQFVELPLEHLGDHLVIGKTCDNDGVWGIHVDDLSPKKQHNPMVQMSRNFDAIEQSEIHWFDELPLAEFLLAQAIINGVNGGLKHHAQIYDFDGQSIPADLNEKLQHIASEIIELRQPHERYFQAEDFGVVMLLGMDESIPNAFMIASQDEHKFNDYIQQLAIKFAN
ncbi:conserved hypothetical protein [Enhydrobacter sp. AX1]|nr:hypothetical protein [Enhydrobacter sp. AX1]VXA91042.1 conserved hypothetical protein [Enhydrobacter sp. AX1]